MKHVPTKFFRYVIAIALLCGATALVCMAQSPKTTAEDKDLAHFMRKKLDASSKILEGLAVEDMDLIQSGASSLLQMSKAELWNVITDAEYREFNAEFRSSLRKLEEAATKKNLDNALLQWIDTQKGCVECHKYVRDSRTKLKKN